MSPPSKASVAPASASETRAKRRLICWSMGSGVVCGTVMCEGTLAKAPPKVRGTFTSRLLSDCLPVTWDRETRLKRTRYGGREMLDDAPTTRFHRRAVLASGMGFFTDAYDLFVISTVAVLVKSQWHLGTTTVSILSSAAILGAFFGALDFGRIADILGRRAVYVVVAAVMIVGALASALATNVVWLVAARFVLGLGIGGDYPVSAVLMSEYSNRTDRGRLVGLVFSMQALGLIVGPVVA